MAHQHMCAVLCLCLFRFLTRRICIIIAASCRELVPKTDICYPFILQRKCVHTLLRCLVLVIEQRELNGNISMRRYYHESILHYDEMRIDPANERERHHILMVGESQLDNSCVMFSYGSTSAELK